MPVPSESARNVSSRSRSLSYRSIMPQADRVSGGQRSAASSWVRPRFRRHAAKISGRSSTAMSLRCVGFCVNLHPHRLRIATEMWHSRTPMINSLFSPYSFVSPGNSVSEAPGSARRRISRVHVDSRPSERTNESRLRCEGAEARFWSHVDRSGGMFACWPFTGGHDRDGYGAFWLGGRHVKATRFAWLLIHGEDPGPRSVLHHCDNPPCCNPRCLYLGDQTQNVRDRDARGRTARGTRNGRNKLSPQAVAVIRRWQGRVGKRRIARLFRVDDSTIRDIWKGRIWRNAA
jgi:hypothetical protein